MKSLSLLLLCLLSALAWGAKFRDTKRFRDTMHKSFDNTKFQELKTQKAKSFAQQFSPDSSLKDPAQCETEKIRVHLIPHSHDDVGWLKTLDDYYWGNKDYIQRAGVQYIYDGVTKILEENPTKKFIVVEVAFFQRWWHQQTEDKRGKFRKLVENGQIEFIGGGYAMNDEATAYYEDMIDQMTIGHQFLKRHFNVTPTVGWQIDPFGHSNTQASLFSQMGINSMFFARIDYQDMQVRRDNQGLETVWQPRTSKGTENALLAHVNYYHYDAPPTFCFDIVCDDEPIMDDPRLAGYNLLSRVEDLVKYFRTECLHYRSNTLMHNIGSDFQFRIPEQNFKNWDKLVNYINAHPEYNMELSYSTPSDYINDINAEEHEYPVKEDDFFPYADNTNAYWTGYFTSRVALKGYIREVGRFAQTFKKLVALSFLQDDRVNDVNFHQAFEAVKAIDEAMGINQHHDAVAGTAKQHVTDDYVRLLHEAEQLAVNTTAKLISELLGSNLTYAVCRTNATASEACKLTQQALDAHGRVLITVVNPSTTANRVVRIKVPHKNLRVVSPDRKVKFQSEVVCTAHDNCDLFLLDEFKSFAVQNYLVVSAVENTKLRANSQDREEGKSVSLLQRELTVTLDELNTLKIKRSGHDFELERCEKDAQGKKTDCQTFEWALNYRYYTSYARDGPHEQNSGAYIFRPDTDTLSRSRPYSYILSGKLYDGEIVKQIHLRWNNMESVIRFYPATPSHFEVETLIQSIDISDKVGKEITVNFATNLNNEDTFYTDSNGLEMQKRVKDFRETWDLEVNQPVAGNYYPVNSAIYMEDPALDQRVTVLVDRSQGASVVKSGEIELMIHRRILHDDDRGVVEALNETEPDGTGLRQRVTHYLVFDRFSSERVGKSQRSVQRLVDQPLLTLTADPANEKIPPVAALKGADELPELVKLFVQPLVDGDYLVRLQNLDEDDNVTVAFPAFLKEFASVEETTLTGNQRKDDMLANKLTWNNIKLTPSNEVFTTESKVRLAPLEIRSFVMSTKQKAARTPGSAFAANHKRIQKAAAKTRKQKAKAAAKAKAKKQNKRPVQKSLKTKKAHGKQ